MERKMYVHGTELTHTFMVSGTQCLLNAVTPIYFHRIVLYFIQIKTEADI